MVDIIGAGFGRTGTASLRDALEILGYGPCHHMTEVIQNPGTAARWIAALAGDSSVLPGLLGKYRATQDFPGALLWREMTELYPHAKVLLSVRDPKEWYNSARATILNQDLRRHLEQAVLPDARRMAETLLSLTDAMTARGFPVDHGEQEAIASFERHNEAVRAAVDPDRLLVYEVRQGWEPLCAFLGVDVPDKPFPRGNEAGVFAGKVRRLAAGESDSTS
ncbi:sulfotransferase family protein [Streptomyces ossamyceticus]|uniref:Sulfotransferase family protein n=1 Tax=Streptomyces ossamyceticus TaxID=249581 RepID=A0ABV2UZQ9_9ACTN